MGAFDIGINYTLAIHITTLGTIETTCYPDLLFYNQHITCSSLNMCCLFPIDYWKPLIL